MRDTFIGRQHKFGLCAAIGSLAATTAVAGPHHWQRWTEGTVAAVDATRRVLVVRDSQGGPAAPFHWNRRTRLWDKSMKPNDRGRPVKAEALTASTAVRILSRKSNRRWLAARIVISPAGAGDKSIFDQTL